MAFQTKKYAVINRDFCVACGCCVLTCPLSALEIHSGSFAVTNQTKCVGCGKCSTVCPASIIEIEVTK